MRDPKRIRPFLDQLARLWEQHPDLRFGQLIIWLDGGSMPANSFNWEESIWEEVIREKTGEKT